MSRPWTLLQDAFLFWRGRVAALLLLFGVASAIWVSDPAHTNLRSAEAVGQSSPMAAVPFAGVRQWLFDSYQRVFPRERSQQPVVIVEIDEKSLEAQGQWPWPRNRLAQLVDAVAARQPAAIGLDIYMPEPDETSPDRVARNLTPDLASGAAALADALKDLPSHDTRLAQSLAAAPTVLGVAGFDYQAQTSSEGVSSVPMRVQGGDPRPWLRRYPRVLASLPELQRAARGKAVLSVSGEDPVIRRVLLVAAVAELVMPSLAMEMLRVASANPAVDMTVGPRGIETLGVGDFSVATQSAGDIWLHYARYTDGFTRRISAADVLAGRIPDGLLEHKLVLVGLTGSGLSDRRVTALRELVPGVEIQAQVLESFFEGRVLLRPWWMKSAELVILLACGFVMVWLVPQARRRFAGPSGERKRWGWVVMGLGAFLLAVGYGLFRTRGLLFDAASLVVGLTCLAACLASSSILEIERDNLRLGRDRERLREEAARVAGELEAARRIQLGSLPDAKREFPGEERFQIATLMQPAREVGGDLYDFFMIDHRRLCFLVGDVSGKGLPASLFMSVTKTLTRSIAMHMGGSANQVVSAVSLDLARENSEMLFVTLLLGVLDVQTGELELVNAGHEAPWCVRAQSRRVEQWAVPPGAGGPPLCVIDGFPYKSQRAQMQPGDTVCFITDGISEAMDASNAFYGHARLRAVLSALPAGASVEGITDRIRDDVSGFVAGAEQSDDVALVVLRWAGPAGGK